MTEQVKFVDFSSGWIPSDDQVNGRKNGLLRMTGATLNENGALVMANGTRRHSTLYPSPAHTIYSKYICGVKRRYLALEDGSIYRDGTIIVDAGDGSLTRAAFGVFGDFVLIGTGKTLLKDTCDSTVSELILEPPEEELTVIPLGSEYISETAGGTFSNWVLEYGAVGVSGSSLSITSSVLYLGYGVGSGHNTNVTDFPPEDFSGLEDDIFQFDLSMTDPSVFEMVQINYLLNSTSTDYFRLDISKTDASGLNPATAATIKKFRSDFNRIGTNNSLGWNNVIGMQIICRSKVFGALGVFLFSNFKWINNAESPLVGTYTWLQVNVYRSGTYEVHSVPGPESEALTIENGTVNITPEDPSIVEPDANEVWLYRKGGELPYYYRVKRMLYEDLADFTDNLSDADVLAMGDILNESLLTVDEDNLEGDIQEIVGPVNGRVLYFTDADLLFSPPNQPDSFDPALTIKVAGTEGEIFYWARKVAENVVLVGTSHDVYSLSGSFITQPDGTLDAYLRPLGLDKPPICRDVVVYKSSLIYYTPFGWTLLSLGGDHHPLTYPNVHVLYSHTTRYEYHGVLNVVADDFRYSLCISRDRMYCVVPTGTDSETTPSGSRFEVYDILGKFWEPHNYAPTLLYTEEDGNVIGFFEDLYLKSLNQSDTKLLNTTT